MSTVSIRLPEDVSNRLHALTRQTGHTFSEYVIDVIRTHLDDMEDIDVAEHRLIEVQAGRSRTHTLEEVERALDLAD